MDRSCGSVVEVWVLLEDVPSELRSVPGILAFAELVGKPIAVDEDSLSRRGSVRVSVWVKDAGLVHGSVVFVPEMKAYRIKVRVEGAPDARCASPLLPPNLLILGVSISVRIARAVVPVGRLSLCWSGKL